MVQKILFGLVISLFLFVWGAVIFQFLTNDRNERDLATDLPNVSLDGVEQGVEEEKEEKDQEVKEEQNVYNDQFPISTIRKSTEENKLKRITLENGIDYGYGVSVDDLLEEFSNNLRN